MNEQERIIAGREQDADGWQYSLRPRRLAEYIGQNQVKQNMQVFIKAAAERAGPWQNHACQHYCQ